MAISAKAYKRYILAQYWGFLLSPLILILVNGGKVEGSISAYALATPLTFAVLMTLIAKLFITEGATNKTNYFEIVIGLALLLLTLFDMEEWTKTHYTFAVIFFEGIVFNMIYYSSKRYRVSNILLGLALNLAMLGCFGFGWYSIFWAEWIALIPISAHKILETLNRIK